MQDESVGYAPEPRHIQDDFYAVELTGWMPINEKGEILLPNGTVTLGETPPTEHWPYYVHEGKSVHRMVALTYHPCPGDPDDYQVNHKDGIKINNAKGNLEWSTVSQNVTHAYMAGLRNDNRPILARDLETGKEERFYSLQSCARSFDVNGSLIRHYLKGRRDKPWRKKWVFIYEGEKWPELDKSHITDSGMLGARDIIAVPVDGGTKIIFPGINAAAKVVGVKRGTIGWYLRRLGKDGSNRHKGYDWYYLSEYIGDLRNVEKKGSISAKRGTLPKRTPKRVRETDLKTGDIKEWESLWVLADHTGWKKNSLEKAIWRNNGVVNGKQYEYIAKSSPAGQKRSVGSSLIAGKR